MNMKYNDIIISINNNEMLYTFIFILKFKLLH